MSIHDRDYMSRRRGGYRGSGAGTGMTMTHKLIAANVVVFLVMFGTAFGAKLSSFCIMQPDAVLGGEVWRLFTATYMHANFWGHLFFNMLVLLFLGPAVEQAWGARKFLFVYTACGVAGNVAMTLLSQVGYIDPQVLGLGASGCVLGVLGAAAVLFPRAQILLFFVLPMSLRTAALLFTGIYILNLVGQGSNYGGDICHLAGLAIGAGVASASDR